MKKYLFLLIILILVGFNSKVFSQGVTTQGTEFWVSFGSNANRAASAINLQVRVVASKATTVTMTYMLTNTVEIVQLSAGEVYTKDMNDTEETRVYASTGGITSKSLHIETTEPVSVYALNQSSASADATNVLPVNNLGTSYYQISYNPLSSSHSDGYVVVATEDATEVYEAGVLKATLQTGQVFAAYYANTNVTGRYISSNKPIAYFAVNTCVNVPVGTTACDCLYQQMVPVNAWGNNFLVPVTKRGVERVRIVASQNETLITHVGGELKSGSLSLNAGQYAELEVYLDEGGCFISSEKPIGVCSFLIGTNYSALTHKAGDPALAWVPPIEQSVNGATIAPFIPSGSTNLKEHYALIVTEASTKDETIMAIGTDNSTGLSGGTWTVNATSGYAFYSLQLTQTSSYFFSNPNGLTVMGYGLGSAESYYYLSGAAARNLDAAFYVDEIHYQDIDGSLFCGGSLYEFRAAIQYAMSNTPGYLKWYINGIEEVSARDAITWNKTLSAGTYTIRMDVLDMTNSTNTLSTSFTVYSRPSVDPLPDITACLGDHFSDITLSGNSSSTIYEWSGGNIAGLPDGSSNEKISGFVALNSASVTVSPVIRSGDFECIGTPSGFNIYTTIPLTGSISSGEYLWTGGSLLNDSWNNPENWVVYDGNSYNLVSSTPLTSTNVRIMGYGGCVYDPNIHSDASSVCRNLTITNTNLVLNNSILNVYGSWLNEGVYTPNNNTTIIFTGNTLNRTIKSGGSDFSNIKFDFSGDIRLSDILGVKGKGEFDNGIVYGDVIFRENSASSISPVSYASFVAGSVTRLGYGDFIFPLGDVSVRTLYEGFENIEYHVLGLLSMSPSPSNNLPEVKVSYYFDNTGLPSWWSTSNNLSPELHHVSDREYWKVESNCALDNLSLYWYNNDNCVRNNLAETFVYMVSVPKKILVR